MILVTGDVLLDHNVYEGGRLSPDAPSGNGSRYLPILGGAMLTYEMLKALRVDDVQFGLEGIELANLQVWPGQFHTNALWHAVSNMKPGYDKHWALERSLGYGEPGSRDYPATRISGLEAMLPKILILDDGGLGFRDAEICWPEFLNHDRPKELEWVILKMSRPLVFGDLWHRLMRASWRGRLIVIVSADHLRSEGLCVAGGLSWETTVDDIVGELESNRPLRVLAQSRHLIVTMRSDAALWLDQPGGSKPAHCQLVFDRKLCEGEWEEEHKDWKAYGFLSTVTASVATAVSDALRGPGSTMDFTIALASGLSATRFLRERGHGPAGKLPAFPFDETAEYLKIEAERHGKNPKFAYTGAEVRCEGGVCRIGDSALMSGKWTILGQVSPWHAAHDIVSLNPARRVALLGPDKLPGVPCATFGQLQTFDRYEIDSLRSIRQLMLLYRRGDGVHRKQPLCLGVFGVPGSGKSFGLKQIAAGIFGDKVPILEFNLSQFKDSTDLIGAFHQVRDKVLSGATPVVFWDEFDSRDMFWLQFFLAPMQDGTFQEGQITHFVGKSVFIFAGGTRYSFDEFRTPKNEEVFKLQKGPDFISRLSGYLDIAGPNKRATKPGNPVDREFPVRRAMVIRNALKLDKEPLPIERGLLTALLAISQYCNGARSLDKLVTYIRDRGGLPLGRAFLPPDDILALYVGNVREFHELTRKYSDFYAQADLLAPAIHADWLAGLSPEGLKTKATAVPWNDLPADIKDSNVVAALRIPEILELAGLTLEEGSDTSPEAIQAIEDKLELMSEAEHGGWEEQKRIDGWTYSPNRLDAAFRHNLLLPYDLLTEDIKKFDRDAIRNYPKNAHLAGYKIVPLSLPKPE